MNLMPFSKHDLLYTVLSPILMFSSEFGIVVSLLVCSLLLFVYEMRIHISCFFTLYSILSIIKCITKFKTFLYQSWTVVLYSMGCVICNYPFQPSCFKSSNKSIYVDHFQTIVIVFLSYVLGAQKNRLIETVLLNTHNIFEYPQHMFWLRNKKINVLVCTQQLPLFVSTNTCMLCFMILLG